MSRYGMSRYGYRLNPMLVGEFIRSDMADATHEVLPKRLGHRLWRILGKHDTQLVFDAVVVWGNI